MTPKTATRTSGAPARSRHSKAKPRFELPKEQSDQSERNAAAAWVHRTAQKSEPELAESALRKEETIRRAKTIPVTPNEILSLGIALMTASLVVAGQVSLTTLGILAAPVRWSRRFLPV
jgi:hypothetical protein